jgi:hypothetical protein
MPLQIDPHLIPATLDLYHLVLLGLVVLLLVLHIMLLSFATMALLNRKPVAVQTPVVPSTAVPAPPSPKPVPAEPRRETVVVREVTPDAALQLLGLLQKEARFLDFIAENMGSFQDAEIGAVARVVHDGCRKVINAHFVLEPVRSEPENARLILPKGYDAASIRVSGNIVGQAPFTGTLIHRGWKAAGVKLPRVAEGHDINIIAQAEVEL